MISLPPDLARSALDAAPDAMIIVDDGGVIRFTNRQVSALFGYDHDEIVGQPIEILLPGRFRTPHIGHRQHYLTEKRVRQMGVGLPLFACRRDGTEFPVEISLSPVGDGERPLVAAAIRDATQRQRAEADLVVAREAADGARLQADVARDIADRANRSKSRFLAAASHDLRQPLQTLALLNGALRRVVTETEAANALVEQDQAIGAMSRLLNSLLDISKLESGAVKPDPVDFKVAHLFEELRAEFSGLATSKGLQLDIESSPQYVRSDPLLVGQILRNLISNAIKYTREGRVYLRCLYDAPLVRIEVQDTGVGISAEHLPSVCDEFFQVGVSTNSSRDGYGLGLSIVQRLVSLLRLQFDVRSEVGRGSIFAITLPAREGGATTELAQTSPSAAKVPPAGKARVLLVEDDAGVRRATRMLLTVEGYSVTSVASLAEALHHVQAGNEIDLLITDYHLGDGKTGTQVIAALREWLGTSLKAVITTGDTSTAIKDLPSDPLLRIASKPIQAGELLAMLRALLASESVR